MHLRDLNRGLSLRNSITTIMVHLSSESGPTREITETIAGSNLIKVTLNTTGRGVGTHTTSVRLGAGGFLRSLTGVLNWTLFTPALNRIFARAIQRWRRVPRRAGEALQAGITTRELIRQHKVDLVVLHTNGGSDASEVISAARSAGVPIALIHHFSNDKLGNISVRQQVADVCRIGGASSVGLPFYVRPHFINLSDAVDLEFFSREKAGPVPVALSEPVLFAPGRLTPEKGQMDALLTSIELLRRGVKHTLVFAGRMDDPHFERSLREKACSAGISDSVYFAGELSLPRYRDWFSKAYLTLMPTHHLEGMPRTLIDSQAMHVPPIVYDIGGTRDGVRHNKTGFLVPLGDISAMTEHAAVLLESKERRDQMAVRGREFVESEFSLDAFLARHEKFYLEAISCHRHERCATTDPYAA